MDLEELQEKFTQYGKQLSEGDSEEKLIATAWLLRAISEYFEKNAPNTNISGITLLMGELASIAEGNSPKFIKPLQKTAGRSYDPLKNIQDASIVTAIEILMRHGMEKEQALKFVSNETKLKTSTLDQMRKDFNRRKRMPEAFDFLVEQRNEKFNNEAEMKSRVFGLLAMAMK